VLALLDWLLNLTHTAVVLASLSLWAFRTTRRWHLVLVLLTAGSWLGLGFWYGLGYCFLTDWHWQIKAARGAAELPHSFVQYLVYAASGDAFSPAAIDKLTGATFATVFVLSVALNLRDARSEAGTRT